MKTFKYRIYPTKKQQTVLLSQLEICRKLYNTLLGQRKDAWKKDKTSFSEFDQNTEIVKLKKTDSELKLVNAQVLQNVSRRINLAYDSFYRRCKKGEQPGYPRFKGENTYKSMTFPQFRKSVIVKDNKIYIPKVGNIKLVQHKGLQGIPKTATIYQSNNKWFVSIICKTDIVHPEIKLPKKLKATGVDVGIKNFATLDNGEKIENPRYFERFQREIAKVNRRTPFGKRKSKKNKKIINRLYEKITNCRHNFLHHVVNRLLSEYDVIVIEDLNINSMKEKRWCSKQISDCSWATFFSILLYKAEWAGKTVTKVNPAFTSQDCSECWYRVTKKLSGR